MVCHPSKWQDFGCLVVGFRWTSLEELSETEEKFGFGEAERPDLDQEGGDFVPL